MKDVALPPLAEGVNTATVSYIYVKKGDVVKEGDNLLELVTDKATFNLPSPCPGAIADMLCNEGDQVNVGQVLMHIEGQ